METPVSVKVQNHRGGEDRQTFIEIRTDLGSHRVRCQYTLNFQYRKRQDIKYGVFLLGFELTRLFKVPVYV